MTRFKTALRAAKWTLFSVALVSVGHGAVISAELKKAFVRPLDSAPAVGYWIWLDSNISSNGITADLETC